MKVLTVADDIVAYIQTPGGYAFEAIPEPFSAIAGPSQPRIIWRPDGTGDARTWAEVVALIGAKPGCHIYVDDQTEDAYHVTTGVWHVHLAVFEAPVVGIPITVAFDDGSTVDSLAGATGQVVLAWAPTGPGSLTWNDGTQIPTLTLTNFASAQNNGTSAVMHVPQAAFILQDVSGVAGNGSGVPFIDLGSVAGAVLVTLREGAVLTNDWLSGGTGGAALVFITDGSLSADTYPTMPGYGGSIFVQALTTNGASGDGGKQPASTPNPVPIGCVFYNTDLRRFQYYDDTFGSSAWHTMPLTLAKVVNHDVGTLNAASATTVTIPYADAKVGDAVTLSPSPALPDSTLIGQAHVTPDGTISAVLFNFDASYDPGAIDWSIALTRP